MSQRVYWYPPTDLTPDTYTLHYYDGGTERKLAEIPNAVPGPYWEPQARRFSLEDPQGTDTTIYRVRALGPGGALYGDTGPFQPSAATGARMSTRVKVDSDFGGVNELQMVTPEGQPIPDAQVRFFLATEWDANRRDVAMYVVNTNAQGRMKEPVWLEPGLEYVVLFERTGAPGYRSEPVRIDV